MVKKLYIFMILGSVWLSYTSCSDDNVKEELDSNEIRLSGIMTRADGDVYSNLHLKAIAHVSLTDTYIPETAITVPDGLEEAVPNDINLSIPRYYPLGNNPVNFYAYTGNLVENQYVRLTSGQTLAQDALLSNQGYSQRVSGLSTEGEGTPGSAQQPATILQFRHLMTRVNVFIKVDSTEANYVDPVPEIFDFRMGTNFSETGNYDITAKAPVAGDEANAYTPGSRSGTYTAKLGTNYIVPNGLDIRDLEFTYLKIDDYVATPEDLAALSITNIDSTNDPAWLLSGYAYNITFLIQKLRVQEIRIEQVKWDARAVENDDISYEPYLLQLELDEYVNAGDDAIQKVVLYTSEREYVGALEEGEMRFVTLPADNMVDSVALYTSLGMLIAMPPDSYSNNGTTAVLDLALSKGGMRLLDPLQGNSEDNPYLISTPTQVFNIAKELTASYRQVNDIDVARLTYTEANPLGSLDTFEGTFDGNGYKVQNLVMTGAGLINRNEGTIKNLHIASGRINAVGEAVAGAICSVNAGILVACINEARIINAPDVAGGICGANENGAVVIACVNNGDIEGGETLGGICGRNENPAEDTFMACVNTGLLAKGEDKTLGAMIGTSVTTPEVLIRNSFWLVGTAAKTFGGTEQPVGNTFDIGYEEVSALSPEKLRNDISERESESDSTISLLNDALQLSGWGNEFVYVLDQETTGSVWPIPVKR